MKVTNLEQYRILKEDDGKVEVEIAFLEIEFLAGILSENYFCFEDSETRDGQIITEYKSYRICFDMLLDKIVRLKNALHIDNKEPIQ